MAAVIPLLLAAVLGASRVTAAPEQRLVSLLPRVPAALIVGRAVCGATTWLLTDASDLVSIRTTPATARRYHVTGLQSDDRPWGLACLRDGSLWTLASPRTVARITEEGRAVEHRLTRTPRVALFGAGGRFLFQQMPFKAGAPLLYTSDPNGGDTQAWAGLLARGGATEEAQLQANLVHCGIGRGGIVPCWFTDDLRIIISTGATARTVKVAAHSQRLVDRGTPIWDVALVENDRLWVLVATPAAAGQGRPTGGRVVLVDRRGHEMRYVNLARPARLIISATVSRCVVLTIDGQLLEVSAL